MSHGALTVAVASEFSRSCFLEMENTRRRSWKSGRGAQERCRNPLAKSFFIFCDQFEIPKSHDQAPSVLSNQMIRFSDNHYQLNQTGSAFNLNFRLANARKIPCGPGLGFCELLDHHSKTVQAPSIKHVFSLTRFT